MLGLIIFITLLIGFGEGMPLIRQKKWKELTVMGILIAGAFLVIFGRMLRLPTPLEWLDHWLRPVGMGIFKRF